MKKDVVFVFEVLNLLRFRLEIDGIMNALSMDGQIIKWRIPLVFQNQILSHLDSTKGNRKTSLKYTKYPNI